MSRLVDPSDLIDSRGVAGILGLSHYNSVTTYLRRYPDMPPPVVELQGSRIRLWVKQDIELWAEKRRR